MVSVPYIHTYMYMYIPHANSILYIHVHDMYMPVHVDIAGGDIEAAE